MIGITVSQGIAIAKPFIIHKEKMIINEITGFSYQEENQKIQDAFQEAKKQIQQLQEAAIKKVGKEEGNIFEAHLMMLEDPMLHQFIDKGLKNNYSAATAIQKAKDELIQIFENISDPYIKGRIADIQDVTDRLLRIVLGKKEQDLSLIEEPVILIAEDLTPSETIGLSKQVKGIITETGGLTSHAAILAKALELPAIVGSRGIIEQVKNTKMMILDTLEGIIILDPTEDEINKYQIKKDQYEKEKQKQMIYAKERAITKDGKKY